MHLKCQIHAQHFFAEDILSLTRVLYQAVTCDFSTKWLNLPGTAVKWLERSGNIAGE
jgi:hypothetical protein